MTRNEVWTYFEGRGPTASVLYKTLGGKTYRIKFGKLAWRYESRFSTKSGDDWLLIGGGYYASTYISESGKIGVRRG